MIDDLKRDGISKTITKWRKILEDNTQFSINLANYLLHKECKY
jgi:hypothetical protein